MILWLLFASDTLGMEYVERDDKLTPSAKLFDPRTGPQFDLSVDKDEVGDVDALAS